MLKLPELRVSRAKKLWFLLLLPISYVLSVWLLAPVAATLVGLAVRFTAYDFTLPGAEVAARAARAQEYYAAAEWYAHHPAATAWAWLTRGGEINHPEVRAVWLAINLIAVFVVAGAWLYKRLHPAPEWAAKRDEIIRGRRGSEASREQTWKEKRSLDRLAQREHPADGVFLGVEKDTANPVTLTDAELNTHCLIVGTTGSGKTTTVLNFVQSAAQRGLPLIVIDGKGDSDLVQRVRRVAEAAGRPFRLFSMSAPSAHYNPLRRGGVTEKTDKLLNVLDLSGKEPFYRNLAYQFIQTVFTVLEAKNVAIDMHTLLNHLDPDVLAIAVRSIEDEQTRNHCFAELEMCTENRNNLRNVIAEVHKFTSSEFGHLLATSEDEIDILDAIDRREVVVFSLNSLSFAEQSRKLGKVIVSDTKTAVGELYRQNRKGKTYVIFDEFNVFASETVVDLVNKARGAGMHVVLAVQSLADIEASVGRAVTAQIVENCNTFIIQKQKEHQNAEALAQLVGTKPDFEITHQINENVKMTVFGGVGTGSIRRTREFIVHPDEIKRLRRGEAVLLREDYRVQRVWIRTVS